MEVEYKVTMHGPLFDMTAPGIAAQMVAGITEHVTEVGRDMVLSFSAEFKSHPTWRWEMDMTGAVLDSHHGHIYDRVPYAAWLEGVSSRNLTSRFKGYHMWKTSAAWLRDNAADIAQSVVARWMPYLGGRGAAAPGEGLPPIRSRANTAPPKPGWVPWENSRFDPDGRRTG